MTRRILLSCTLSALALLSACKPAGPGSQEKPSGTLPVVQTANYPLFYFAKRLADSSAEVVFAAPADEDPAFWQPDDAALAAFQQASLILMNGATYSKWAEKATLPASKIVDTSAAFKDRLIQIKDATTHSHGPGGDHSHSGTAFTTWVDFQQALLQAEAVKNALLKLTPAAAAEIETRFDALKNDLEALDSRMAKVAEKMKDVPLVASHPVYHYWSRRYQLQVHSVLWEPETVPDDAAMAELKSVLEKHPAKWMIWEGDPAPESVAKLQALGIQSLVFDPCGNRPEEGDFITVVQANIAALEKAFAQ